MLKHLSALGLFVVLSAPSVEAQDLKIVAGKVDTTYTSTVYLRGMGPKNSSIETQGNTYPIYSSGEWAVQLKLNSGDNPFTLTAKDGQTIQHSIFLKERVAPAPITELKVVNAEILPSPDMLVKAGDVVKIRLRSMPESQISWIGGEKLSEVSAGVYQGQYVVKQDDKVFNSPIEITLKNGDKTAKETLKSSISFLSENAPVCVRTKEGAYFNYGLGADRLGGAKINFLSEGIVMKVAGKIRNMYKVQLSKSTIAWIPESYVEVMPEGTFSPESLTGSWSVRGNGRYDYVNVGLEARLPYTVTEDADRSRIIVDIYGAACNTNWITQLKSNKGIRNVSYEQIEDDVFRLMVDLKDKQMWGYSVYYQGNSLVVCIKNQLEDLRLKNLTIAIDAGHGNPWNGAQTTSGVKEQDLNLDMALHLKKVLEKKGVKVVMTRQDENEVGMSDRKNIALKAEADIFVSIHCNAGGSPFTGKGTSTYYRHLSHKNLADDILDYLLEMPVNNFGLIGNFNFSLNQPTEYLSVLVETLFLSSPEDSSRILDKEFRDEMIERVAFGIEKFLSQIEGSHVKDPKEFKRIK